MTKSSEELKVISRYGQETTRRYWCKSTRPFRFQIGGYPKPIRSCPMERHRTATALTLDYLANRETELIQFNPEVL